ncbi:glycosyltransferase family 4 protein [Vibrio sp. Scap16]|uniref:glycosyltransferase family 4 protein n=1 Tax=Vibrio sp. Scap16 TaxID=2589989 RepID=UPI00159D870A|nr:glycosyltransferase family 4 protein [Vibrio sp. Scap16]NVN83319.1 glycosyltransferase family 4 protein [Vibrio sp. Scap16]
MSTIKPNLERLNQNHSVQAQEITNPEPQEIWLLIDSQTFGGIETHVIELTLGLIEHQCKARVILLTKFEPLPPIITRLTQLKLPFCHLSDITPSQGNALSQLKLAITQFQPSHIHAHGYKASIVAKLAKLTASSSDKPRQISTYHAGETPTGKVWLYDFLDRYTSVISDHSLVVSDKIKEKLPSKSTLLNNFIAIPKHSLSPNVSDETQIADLTYHVGFVGRLSHEKAPDRFITLAQANPDHHFHLFGDGPERQALESSNCKNLTFHGHQTNMSSAWQTIDVLVIPSRYEGLPMAALEAMARGIPVIATNVGNLPQLIEHQTNGYIAQSETQLQTCLIEWLDLSNQEKYVMSQKARNTIIDQYSPQAVIPQILACYGN